MQNIKPASIFLYIFLLISGVLIAFIIWLIAIMPLQIVRPIEFSPLKTDENILESAESKIHRFLSEDKILKLTLEEAGGILKKSIEKNLGLNITDVYLGYDSNFPGGNRATAIFKVEIKDIPVSNFLTLFLRLRNIEYTTTLISATVRASNGGIDYTINDFRIGGFKMPGFVIKRLFRKGNRNIDNVKLVDIKFRKEYIILIRE